MTNSDTGHGGQDLEQLRADLETVVAERNRALSELAELKARLTAQDIVIGTTAAQPLPPASKERHLRLIKGGVVGAALLAGVEWLRRHREVAVALVVAGVAAVAAWLMWPDDQSPSGRPPVQPTVTVTETSVSSSARPSTAAPTLTPSPGVPSPTPRATPTPTDTGEPTAVGATPIERTTIPSPPETTITVAPGTTAPTSATPTQPSTRPTTAPPRSPSPTPFCVTVMPGQGRVWVCKTGLLAPAKHRRS